MMLPWIVACVFSPLTRTPTAAFPEMRLPEAVVLPPMMIPAPLTAQTPPKLFGIARVPVTSVPILFPWTITPDAEMPRPVRELPEITCSNDTVSTRR